MFPEFIQSNIAELTALCEKFPISLPTEKVAAFLHTDAESLKAAVEQGKCPSLTHGRRTFAATGHSRSRQ